MKHIAIVRLSALGDVIVSASMAACIKHFCPEAKLHWYVDSRFAGILSEGEVIDKVYATPFKKILSKFNLIALWKLFRQLRSREYDCVIDMQGLIKSAIFGKMLKTTHYVGFDKYSAKEALAARFYTQGVGIAYQESILKRNAYIIYKALDLRVDFKDFLDTALRLRDRSFVSSSSSKASISSILIEKIDRDLKNRDIKFILFVTEASLAAKTYDTQHFIELGKMLLKEGFCPVVLWHQDKTRAQEILAGMGGGFILPRLDLDGLKALIDRMDVVVGGDTGVTHLAWAMKCASVTLYGNTPKDRFALPDKRCVSLSGNKNASYKKDDFSINDIKPESIFEAIKEVL